MSVVGKSIKRYTKAFTITEVIVASSLLIVALVPILRALTIAHITGVKIERRTRSLVLAQAKLDQIRARSIYSYTTNFNDSSSSVDGAFLCKVVDSPVAGTLTMIVLSRRRSRAYTVAYESVSSGTSCP